MPDLARAQVARDRRPRPPSSAANGTPCARARRRTSASTSDDRDGCQRRAARLTGQRALPRREGRRAALPVMGIGDVRGRAGGELDRDGARSIEHGERVARRRLVRAGELARRRAVGEQADGQQSTPASGGIERGRVRASAARSDRTALPRPAAAATTTHRVAATSRRAAKAMADADDSSSRWASSTSTASGRVLGEPGSAAASSAAPTANRSGGGRRRGERGPRRAHRPVARRASATESVSGARAADASAANGTSCSASAPRTPMTTASRRRRAHRFEQGRLADPRIAR